MIQDPQPEIERSCLKAETTPFTFSGIEPELKKYL